MPVAASVAFPGRAQFRNNSYTDSGCRTGIIFLTGQHQFSGRMQPLRYAGILIIKPGQQCK